MNEKQEKRVPAASGDVGNADLTGLAGPERAAIARGAANAVRTCMAVEQGERVLVFTDESSRELGEAVAVAARDIAADVELLVLAQEPSRLESDLARGIRELKPDVSFFVAKDPHGNTALMPSVLEALAEKPTRHANMPGADRRCFIEGMSADYQRVAETTLRLSKRLEDGRKFVVWHPNGTHLTVVCGAPRRWCAYTGLYWEPNDWGRLPQGEVFTAPLSVEGVLVAHTVGYPLNDRLRLLDDPVTLHLAEGRAIGVECDDTMVTDAVNAHLGLDRHGRWVGEFAIGSNTYLSSSPPSGVLLFDENIPGIHLALGHPYPEETGADWVSGIHLDFVLAAASISVDGESLLENGRFLADF
jgi:aminopeptidase